MRINYLESANIFIPTFEDLYGLKSYDVILIGCSIKSDADNEMKSRCSDDDDKHIPNPLGGVSKDLDNMKRYFTEKGVRSITIHHPTGEEKETILNQLIDSMEDKNLIIYYSGHGR